MIRRRVTIAVVMMTVSLDVSPGMFPAVSFSFVMFNVLVIAVLGISVPKVFSILGTADTFNSFVKGIVDERDILADFLEQRRLVRLSSCTLGMIVFVVAII